MLQSLHLGELLPVQSRRCCILAARFMNRSPQSMNPTCSVALVHPMARLEFIEQPIGMRALNFKKLTVGHAVGLADTVTRVDTP